MINAVALMFFLATYYGKSLRCSYEERSGAFGPWDTNLNHHVIPSTRQIHEQYIIDEINHVFKHKFTTIYVFGTPMLKNQKAWLRKCSHNMKHSCVLAWGSNLNFIPVPHSTVFGCDNNIASILDDIYDNNPSSMMVMFLPITANLTQL